MQNAGGRRFTEDNSMIDFIFNEPAAYIGELNAIVISDLHIGIEREYEKNGVIIGKQNMLEDLESIIKQNNADKLIIIGDVKHAINPSEKEKIEIIKFFSRISKYVKVIIIKGNHDGGIEKFLDLEIHGPRGIRLGDFYFNHGHTWPDSSLDSSKYLLMGHLHPEVGVIIPGSHRKFHRCWLIGRPNRKMQEYYKFNGKIVIFPAFNPLVGMSIKEYAPGPLFRNSLISMEKMDVYLLDSRHLGSLSSLKKEKIINKLKDIE
ncbi:MAG: metallophosphoesterase [Thermoplasmata archaeon]